MCYNRCREMCSEIFNIERKKGLCEEIENFDIVGRNLVNENATNIA